ncbi:hypothetical protein CAI21_18630 [Alkalilimnicola ehrlichii]|uniref:Uncharacterized protein n=1 Tax=Alkalilimnicola ehrlichii TaxID=351052 RepID=A0A3E0WIP8_9GAMM|nr:hypothetical protein [Alkalilimnicola ehrlichii]RFA25780.1 hypothetical protein CAI21_18630 [Alkalilimnicola ehrlichii]RFA32860.1 hypothetical protein CAL65_18880 [Alkalilimnicola ehrlichii]
MPTDQESGKERSGARIRGTEAQKAQRKGLNRQALEAETKQESQREPEPPLHKPDVLIDVSKLKVNGLKLGVDSLKAQLSLKVRLAQLLDVHVGLDAHIDKVELELDEVDGEIELRASLARLQHIIDTAFSSILEDPDVFRNALGALNEGKTNVRQKPPTSQDNTRH